MTGREPDFDQSRPIEQWSDDELLAQYRYVQAELSGEDPGYRYGEDAPPNIIEEEIERRGLQPDREDVIPDAASPGRGEDDNEGKEPRVTG